MASGTQLIELFTFRKQGDDNEINFCSKLFFLEIALAQSSKAKKFWNAIMYKFASGY